MTILDKDVEEIPVKRSSGKNLINSLLALGLIMIAQIIYYIIITSVGIASNFILIWLLAVLFYVLPVIAGILAVLTLKRCLQVNKTQRDTKNYVAMGISSVVLLGIANEIWHRL
jgi:hypothetical protein